MLRYSPVPAIPSSHGERIEVRGFGSFSLHYRKPKMARNPKTGNPVPLPGRYVVHFKPGKELRERVNNGAYLSDADDEME